MDPCCKEMNEALDRSVIRKSKSLYLGEFEDVYDGEDATGNECYDEMPVWTATVNYCPFCGKKVEK